METQAKKRILLIDDDMSLLVTLSDFLRFEGYDVVTAESGEHGLKKLKGMTPDLIILDMSMPGMGGIGFLKEISSAEGTPKHPVLVLTARANMAEFFANVDVDGFVAKPCDPSDLLMEVNRIVFLRSGSDGGSGGVPLGGVGTVLIGEDDAGISGALQTRFQAAGYTVRLVGRGPAVIEQAVLQRPDVILVKLVFSQMNGDAVAQILQEMAQTKSIPVVLYDDTGSRKPAGVGVRRLVKSHAPEDLLAAVKEVLAAKARP